MKQEESDKAEEQLKKVDAKVKIALQGYGERIETTQNIKRKHYVRVNKRIKENDYVRIYGEGKGAFVTIYPSKNKFKWLRAIINKTSLWLAEKNGKNYIFHKLKNKENLQNYASIKQLKQQKREQYKTPRQITSLEKMFKDLAEEREALKNANAKAVKDIRKLKEKRFKNRITFYIPRFKFR